MKALFSYRRARLTGTSLKLPASNRLAVELKKKNNKSFTKEMCSSKQLSPRHTLYRLYVLQVTLSEMWSEFFLSLSDSWYAPARPDYISFFPLMKYFLEACHWRVTNLGTFSIHAVVFSSSICISSGSFYFPIHV